MITRKFWTDETRTLRTRDGAAAKFRFRAGSDVSQADADAKAAELFDAAEKFFRETGRTPADAERFRAEIRRIQSSGSGDGEYQKPICEEILREIDPRNVVTRNHYGAEVLNSTDTCFIDVDRVRWNFVRVLKNVFSSYGVGEWAMETAAKLAAARENADLGFRVYRTAAGARVIVAGGEIAPGSDRARRLFREFNADPRYARLCDLQKCFRARLTPKPSRMRVRRPDRLGKCVRFPYATEADRLEAKSWVADYNDRAERYAVCRFLKEFGKPVNDPIVDFHDEAVRADECKTLA